MKWKYAVFIHFLHIGGAVVIQYKFQNLTDMNSSFQRPSQNCSKKLIFVLLTMMSITNHIWHTVQLPHWRKLYLYSIQGSTFLTFICGVWSSHEGFSLHTCNCFSRSTSKDEAFLGTELAVLTPSSFGSLLSCDCEMNDEVVYKSISHEPQ